MKTILEHISIEEQEKQALLNLQDYVKNKHPVELTDRIFLFHGFAGTGKTYLTTVLASSLQQEIVYNASIPLFPKPHIRCNSLHEVNTAFNPDKFQVIIIDDLNGWLYEDSSCAKAKEVYRELVSLINQVRNNSNKILIFTLNESYHENFLTEIMNIHIDLPNEKQKEKYLSENFQEILTIKLREYLTNNSIGYTYRDLQEVIKLSSRLGKINQTSMEEALHHYKPKQLHGIKIKHSTTKLNDIIGKKEPLKIIKRLVNIYQKESLSQKLGLKRHNLLLFYGPAGVGKTFSAKALAGEIGYPLICVKITDIFDRYGGSKVNSLMEMAKRYKNCVIFIDEADKLVGNSRNGADNQIIGELNAALDSADDKEINSILILAVNEMSRFGDAFKDRFVHVKFDLPSYEERKIFCSNKAEQAEVKIDTEFIARKTEKMSFRDLERLWNELMYSYLENGTEPNQEIINNILQDWIKDSEEEIIVG